MMVKGRNSRHGSTRQCLQPSPAESAQASPRGQSFNQGQQRGSQSTLSSPRRPTPYGNQFQMPPSQQQFGWSGRGSPVGSGRGSQSGQGQGSQTGSRRASYKDYNQKNPRRAEDSPRMDVGTLDDGREYPALSNVVAQKNRQGMSRGSTNAMASTSGPQGPGNISSTSGPSRGLVAGDNKAWPVDIASTSGMANVDRGSASRDSNVHFDFGLGPGGPREQTNAFGMREGQTGAAASHFGEREEFNPAMHAPFQGQLNQSREAEEAEKAWLHFLLIRCKNVLRVSRENNVDQELKSLAKDMEKYKHSHNSLRAILPQRPAYAGELPPCPDSVIANYVQLHVHNVPLGLPAPRAPPNDNPTITRTFQMYTISWSPARGLLKKDRLILWENYVRTNGHDRNTLNNVFVVYDGNSLVVADKELSFAGQDLHSARGVHIISTNDQVRRYEGTLRYKAVLDFNQMFTFIRRTYMECEFPADIIRALNLIVRQYPILKNWIEIGRQFFANEDILAYDEHSLLEQRNGYFHSVRALHGGVLVNIDVRYGMFYKGNVKLKSALGTMVQYYLPEGPRRILKSYNFQGRLPMTGEQVECVRELWKNLSVKSNHRPPADAQGRPEPPLTYNICDISYEPASRHKVRDKFQRNWRAPLMTLTEFMTQQYAQAPRELEPQLPAIRVNKNHEYYLPWGCLTTCETSKFTLKSERAKPTEYISPKPIKRCKNIQDYIRARQDGGNDQNPIQSATLVEKGFGVELGAKMMTVCALALNRVTLHGGQNVSIQIDHSGHYQLTPRHNFKFFQPVTIDHWALLLLWTTLDTPTDDLVNWHIHELTTHAELKGMTMTKAHCCSYRIDNCGDKALSPSQKRIKLRTAVGDLMERGGPGLQLIICAMDQKMTPWYTSLKYICDKERGVNSQVMIVRPGNANPDPHKSPRGMPYFINLTLKMNAKCGGKNFVIAPASYNQMPLLANALLLGADVTHPTGTDHNAPSIAAVVGSVDPSHTKFATRIMAQTGKRERIEALSQMVQDLLNVYSSTTGRRPEHIFFFRDGVSETQFITTLRYEGTAILNACNHIHHNWEPKLIIILAVKRHHSRFFSVPANKGNNIPVANTNINGGTVIDNTVTHPREFEFYLCSQAPTQGTSRPTKYHVLLDQIEIKADALYKIIYHLCHTFQRSTKAVALVSPVQYAHLAAFRAKQYMEHYMGEYRAQQEERAAKGDRWDGIPMSHPQSANFNASPRLWNHLWFL